MSAGCGGERDAPEATFRRRLLQEGVPAADVGELWNLHGRWRSPGLSEDERVQRLLADHAHWRLFRQAAAGDPAAAGAFTDHWRRYARAYCRDRFSMEEAEEITSAFFARAFERVAARFRWQCPFGTYLRSVLVNAARDLIRRRARRRGREAPLADSPATDARAPASTAPEATMLLAERRVAVREALERLSVDDRRVLLARLVEGRSGLDVAADLGITADAVHQRLHRAKSRLRAQLERDPRAASGSTP